MRRNYTDFTKNLENTSTTYRKTAPIQKYRRITSTVRKYQPQKSYRRTYQKKSYYPKKKYQRRYRKKYYRRKKMTHPSSQTLRSNILVPDMSFVKLKYVTALSISAALGANATYVFRGNSCFDPDFTGVGTQPFGFDEYSAFYQNYRVLGSSVKLLVTNNISGAFPLVAILPSPISNPTADYYNLYGNPYVKKILNPAGNSQGEVKQLKHYISTRKILGLTKEQMGDSSYGPLVTANPGISWYWVIAGQDILLAGDLDVFIYVEITYYTEFYIRRELVAS